MSLVHPFKLIDQPLRLRRTAGDDYTVLVADLTAGRIMRKPMAGGGENWLWSLTGPYLPPGLQPSYGDCLSLDLAKDAMKAKFQAWLHWAVAQGGDVHWHMGAERTRP